MLDSSSSLTQTINDDDVLFLTFNSDAQCFAVGTEKGYYIYNTNPFRELFHRSIYTYICIYALIYRFRWRNCSS